MNIIVVLEMTCAIGLVGSAHNEGEAFDAVVVDNDCAVSARIVGIKLRGVTGGSRRVRGRITVDSDQAVDILMNFV